MTVLKIKRVKAQTLSIQTLDYIPDGNLGGYVRILYGVTGGPLVMRAVISTLFYTGDFVSIFMNFQT